MPEAPVLEAELEWRTVAVMLAAVVGLIAITAFVQSALRPLTWVGVGVLLALALEPVVDRLERQVRRRSFAVGIVLACFLFVLFALVLLFAPAVTRQARSLSRDLPHAVNDLGTLPVIGPSLRHADLSRRIQDSLDELPRRLSGDTAPIERAAQSALGDALAVFATVLTAVTLLLDGRRLQERLRRLVPPQHRPLADRLASLAYQMIARYFAGSVLLAAMSGVSVAAFALVSGVPLAPLLGAWVAVFDLVPQVGGLVGGVPFVIFAFSRSAGTGLAALIFFVLYLNVKNHVFHPVIIGRSVRLSPPTTMTAALVGVSAAGLVGAVVAVPLLGMAKAIYLELRPALDSAGTPDT